MTNCCNTFFEAVKISGKRINITFLLHTRVFVDPNKPQVQICVPPKHKFYTPDLELLQYKNPSIFTNNGKDFWCSEKLSVRSFT